MELLRIWWAAGSKLIKQLNNIFGTVRLIPIIMVILTCLHPFPANSWPAILSNTIVASMPLNRSDRWKVVLYLRGKVENISDSWRRGSHKAKIHNDHIDEVMLVVLFCHKQLVWISTATKRKAICSSSGSPKDFLLFDQQGPWKQIPFQLPSRHAYTHMIINFLYLWSKRGGPPVTTTNKLWLRCSNKS